MAEAFPDDRISSSSVVWLKLKLNELLSDHGVEDSSGEIDTVVLEYVSGIAEDFSADDFDTEEFVEMLTAYVPGFESINSNAVRPWMERISGELKHGPVSSTKNPTPCTDSFPQRSRGYSESSAVSVSSSSIGYSDKGTVLTAGQSVKPAVSRQTSKQKKKGRKSRSSNSTSSNFSLESEEDCRRSLEILSEMFPESCSIQISMCVKEAQGDMEEATQLLLDGAHAEAGDRVSAEEPISAPDGACAALPPPVDQLSQKQLDSDLKDRIVNKYLYLPEEAEGTVHRPFMAKSEPKKMTRYRDGQIVSTKGERFSDGKKPVTDEMKKTYISLKPARQYRFH